MITDFTKFFFRTGIKKNGTFVIILSKNRGTLMDETYQKQYYKWITNEYIDSIYSELDKYNGNSVYTHFRLTPLGVATLDFNKL